MALILPDTNTLYCLFSVFYYFSWFEAVFRISNLLISKCCRAEFELAQIALFCNQKQSWRNLVLGESAMAQIWCRRCATMDHQRHPKASKTLQQHNRPLVFDQEDPVLTELVFWVKKRAKTKWNFWQLRFFQQVCTRTNNVKGRHCLLDSLLIFFQIIELFKNIYFHNFL